MATSLIGRQLGKYQITNLIGQGGMATVYRGYQLEVERYVAIKVLPPHPGQSDSFAERFQQEARTVARLQHPHIVPLYDYGDEDGILYLVMAYIEGGSLNDRIQQGPLPHDDINAMLRQVADALDYAHRQGIIHRDIKPDNILLDGEGHALITDFGIAKLAESNTRMTATGGVVGTPAYLSPEQGQGLPVSPASDIYSLGIVVYEMLTGEQPYQADTMMQVLLQHINGPVPSLRAAHSDFTPALDEALQRALSKRPEDRYPSARAFADTIRTALGQQPAVESASGSRETGPSITATGEIPILAPTQTGEHMVAVQPTESPRWNPLLLLGIFAVVVLVVVTIAVILLTLNPPTTTVEVASPTPVPPVVLDIPTPSAQMVGALRFGSIDADGDTANLQVSGLDQPGAGQMYVAWLYNSGTAAWQPLDRLPVDAFGDGILVYTDPDGAELPTVYNAVAISLEPADAAIGATPAGEIAYSGSIPLAVTEALDAVLRAAPDGLENTDGAPTSLLASAIIEAEFAQLHAGLAADASTLAGMRPHAEHTINILRGTQDDLDGNGRGENPGRGVGVEFFLDRIDAHLNTALSDADADPAVQQQIELIGVCITNSRRRVDEIMELERAVLAAANMDGLQPVMVAATDAAEALVEGEDLNQNGQIEAFEGECGLRQIATFGVSVGNINLVAGPLPNFE
ncbi:MAG: protein kinase [Chloroflexi bacterium]|nr:protein kinase [Chloroflexota bacterium]